MNWKTKKKNKEIAEEKKIKTYLLIKNDFYSPSYFFTPLFQEKNFFNINFIKIISGDAIPININANFVLISK